MGRIDRIYALDRMLREARTPISASVLMERLECSRATLFRLLEHLRDRRGAPLVYDRERNGYIFERTAEHQYELPGLWFNSSELYALLVIQHLIARLQPGLLERHLAPLRERIEEILASEGLNGSELAARVRILNIANRTPGEHFPTVAAAVLQRRRLAITYHGRARDRETERTVSPQRLVHYRGNWYLDAWCHRREALRSFAVDRIRRCAKSGAEAATIDDAALDAHYASAYGIFSGEPRHTAVLRFTPEAARWVADEEWHPQQQGHFTVEGGYELRVPYGETAELVMDILRYAADVEVVGPRGLRDEVAARLRQAAARYPETAATRTTATRPKGRQPEGGSRP